MAGPAGIRVEALDRAIGIGHMPELVDLLADVVEHGAAVGFLAPVTYNKSRDYWRLILTEARDEKRALSAVWDGDRIVGAVQLDLAMPENGSHRAHVEKLMLHTNYRGQGLGRLLLQSIEQVARKWKRTLLTLDVKAGEPAEALYQSEGWSYVGEVPGYALDPDKSALHATHIYCKVLD